MQRSIPYMQLRGGSSKGLFFLEKDLPADEEQRNKFIVGAMEGLGKGDPRQIDGLGGASSLTSKVAIVRKSSSSPTELDYLFLQVVIGKGNISATQTCGNILAAVVPFAIESGLIQAAPDNTTVYVNMLNTGGRCEITIQTPDGFITYSGSAKVDGVPGTASPIICNYLDIQGSTCGALFPTGNKKDQVDGINITCIDNGMPEIIIQAKDLGITGYESPVALNENLSLRQKIETIRLQAGPNMGLQDVTEKTIPKICIIAPAIQDGHIHTRTFLPHVCHEAIGVLGAVSTATACLFEGTVARELFSPKASPYLEISIEHPTGELTVSFQLNTDQAEPEILKSGIIRTARLISKGHVFIPEGIS